MSTINEKLDSNVTDKNEEESNNKNGLFETIGYVKKTKTRKIKPTPPKWFSNSINFSGDIETNSSELYHFESLIDECLIENIKKMKIQKLFPVQKEVVPKLIDSLNKMKYVRPSDICVLSPTGSGKTLAYAIPIINYLTNRIVTQIRALIILPVIDLALQVYKVFDSLCKKTTIRVGLATHPYHVEEYFYKLNSDGSKYLCLVDILIATPGKLIDLIQQNNYFDLKNLEIFVIDEADRMMNETQVEWLKTIEYSVYGSNLKYYCPCLIKNKYSSNQFYNIDSVCACSNYESTVPRKSLFKILFSATFTTDPEKIDNLSLYKPILMNFSSNTSDECTIPENLKELMIIFDQDKKPLILWHLIKNLNYKRILCFTNSIFNAHRLYQFMKQLPQLVVYEYHSKQSIQNRSKILKKFENGLIDIIISTDMTTRGMDIQGIECVVCYDVPRNEIAYIHRIGRTARAGKPGTAITLLSREQLTHFNIIIRRAHKNHSKRIEKLTIKKSDLKNLMPIYQKALSSLQKDVHIEEKKINSAKKKQIKDHFE